MKIVLTTLNAKFIHSALSLHYLKNYCHVPEVELLIKEYTINEHLLDIAGDLHGEKADMIGFSCYIWNREMIFKLGSILKKVQPQLFILLGGPEVSFNPEKIMMENPWVDGIVTGEGEETFSRLVHRRSLNLPLTDLAGLVFRQQQQIILNPERPLIQDLDIIPFPYAPEDLAKYAGRIIYYEASRGCPFNCQYCVSSTTHRVRFFSQERVKKDLEKMILAGVKQIKFVDRTFNCHLKRTKEILAFLLNFREHKINFHFEIAGDLLDEEMIELMGQAPKGFFQVEIGIQSTNPQVLETIKRKMDFNQVSTCVTRLREKGNVHIHLDLIAGLPQEDMISFEKSFNQVYNLKPHHLQLGFLKLLPGTGLRAHSEEYGLLFQDQPPYEILRTKAISFDGFVKLKKIENTLEQIYNSGKYHHTLNFAVPAYGKGAFRFFSDLTDFWSQAGAEKLLGAQQRTKLLLHFLCITLSLEDEALILDLLKLDWLTVEQRNTLPLWLGGSREQDRSLDLSRYLTWAKGLTPKEIFKKVSVVSFHHYFVLHGEHIVTMHKEDSKAIIDYSQVGKGEKTPLIHFVNPQE
jgi:radical SAM superfamily enzyme YgiQ (UPF0313 family)